MKIRAQKKAIQIFSFKYSLIFNIYNISLIKIDSIKRLSNKKNDTIPNIKNYSKV